MALFGPAVHAQEFGAGRTVITPGNMVSDGMGRAQAAVRDPFATTPITETPESMAEFNEPEVIIDTQQILADAVQQFAVNAIARIFAIIANDFLANLGLPELFPDDLLDDVPVPVLPDLSGDTADPQDTTDPNASGDAPDETDTTGGRGGRNGGRPRG